MANSQQAVHAAKQFDLVDRLGQKVIGAGKVRVSVNADLNFDRVVTNTEKFDPNGSCPRHSKYTFRNAL